MSDLSNYLEDELIDHVLRNAAYVTPGTDIYVALYTSDPTDADAGVEVSGGSYARENVTAWDAPSNGATANTAEVAFTEATDVWGLVTHVGIHDHISAGNLLFHAALTVSKQIDSGDTFKFNAGDLDVSLA